MLFGVVSALAEWPECRLRYSKMQIEPFAEVCSQTKDLERAAANEEFVYSTFHESSSFQWIAAAFRGPSQREGSGLALHEHRTPQKDQRQNLWSHRC